VTVLLFELVKLLQVKHPTVHVVLSMRVVFRCKVKIDVLQLLKSFFRDERALLALLEELEVRANIHHPPTQLWVVVVVTRNSAVAVAFFEEIQILHMLLPNIVRGLSVNVDCNAFSLADVIAVCRATQLYIAQHA